MKDEARITIRIPGKLKAWLDDFSDEEGSSVNFEIIRSIRERMDSIKAAAGEGFADTAPAAATRTDAFQGVNSTI